MKRYIPLILVLCGIFLPLLFTQSCANTTEAPTGGKKDTIPPYIVNISPLPGVIGVPLSGASFDFTFNEYVNIKESKNIFISPPLSKAPKAKLRGKTLHVSFEEDLQPNTTYTLSFTDAITDVNEGNYFAGYTYVFSTGSKIDSMMLTGTVRNSATLAEMKGMTVLLYKDHSDSALFKQRPYAAAKTDDWGYFCLPFIQDTLFRLYAIKDENGNNIYDPDTELVGFVDSLVRPVMHASDTVREMLRYDMLDTLSCLARTSEYDIRLFREKPSKQYLYNKARTSERSAYITFMAPNAWIDSLWVRGYRADQLITQFNIEQDSLEIWLNSRKAFPDTLHLFVNYRKTDSLGVLQPELEHLKLPVTNEVRTFSKKNRKSIKPADTTCVMSIDAKPERVEQYGFELSFKNPVIKADFDSIQFTYVTSRQRKMKGEFTVERDSLDIKKYTIRPKEKFQVGYEYTLKFPYRTFRDVNGFYSDSTEVKVKLPSDETLSSISLNLSGVDRKIIVDLLDEKGNNTVRSFVVDKDCQLLFPYLAKGRYRIRITEDSNRNSIVDTGSVLEHRQSEKVVFLIFGKDKFITVPKSTEISQTVNIPELFGL